MATYVNNLRLKEIANGEESGTWGTSTNTNLELIGEAFAYGTEALADSSTQTITMANATADGIRKIYVKLTGTLSQASTITLAPDTVSKMWIIENATSGGYNTVIKQGSGATITIPNGNVKVVATDGGGSSGIVYDLFTDVSFAGTTAMGSVNIDGGAIDAVTLGTNSAVTQAVVDNVNINGSTIGHTSDTDLMTLASGVLTVAGEVSMTTLDIGGTNVTATATELNYVDGVTSAIQTQIDTKASVGKAIAMAMVFG